MREPVIRTGGWIEVVFGSMFSGKTEELLRRLRRAAIARQDVVLFKPSIDQRYDARDVVSHGGARLPSTVVTTSDEILEGVGEAVHVVGIDEGQFFDEGLVGAARQLADRGKRVIVAGLDQDFRGRAFATMAALAIEAEFVTKTLAICMRCGSPALRSQRLDARSGRIVTGGAESYEARCRHCFEGVEEGPSLFAPPVGRDAP